MNPNLKLDFKASQWYVFRNKKDKAQWLALAYTTMNSKVSFSEFTEAFINCYALRLDLEPQVRIRYRTSFHDTLVGVVAQYVPSKDASGTIDVQIATPDTTNTAINQLLELIGSQESEAKSAVENNYEVAVKTLLRKSANTHPIYHPASLLKKYSIEVPEEVLDYEASLLLSPEEQNTMCELEEAREAELSKLTTQFKELRTLLGITETYDQRIQLLVTYGIVPSPVNLKKDKSK